LSEWQIRVRDTIFQAATGFLRLQCASGGGGVSQLSKTI
jgi:hypothetical protein